MGIKAFLLKENALERRYSPFSAVFFYGISRKFVDCPFFHNNFLWFLQKEKKDSLFCFFSMFVFYIFNFLRKENILTVFYQHFEDFELASIFS